MLNIKRSSTFLVAQSIIKLGKILNKHANNREDLVNDGCKLDTEKYEDTNISTFELWLETGLQ